MIAQRSLCSRDQVGCIITDVHNKVIGEGYNGPPRGFWHGQELCTNWCQRTVNARLIRDESNVVSMNGEVVVGLHPTYDDCPSLHAEANALMTSDRTLRANGTIYVTSHICIGCAKLIANSGLQYVYVETARDGTHRNSDASYEFMSKWGLEVRVNWGVFRRKVSQA